MPSTLHVYRQTHDLRKFVLCLSSHTNSAKPEDRCLLGCGEQRCHTAIMLACAESAQGGSGCFVKIYVRFAEAFWVVAGSTPSRCPSWETLLGH